MPKKTRSSRTTKSTKVKARRQATTTASMMTASSTMPAASMTPSSKMSFSELIMMVVSFLIINVIVLFVANLVVPASVVLGNHFVSPIMAVVMAAIIMSFIMVGSMPLIESVSDLLNFKLSDSHWILLYFVINTLSVWFVARFAEIIGLGVGSWIVAVALGFVIDVVQGIMIKMTMNMKK